MRLSKFCPTYHSGLVQILILKSRKSLIFNDFSLVLLTIYDMCKAADRGMVMSDVKLLEKHGGKSGSFVAQP